MLIRTFKSSYLTQYILLAVLFLILYFSGVSSSSIPDKHVEPLTFFPALDSFLHKSAWIRYPLSILTTAVAMMIINSTLTKFEMLPKNTLLGGLVFLLFWYASPQVPDAGCIIISMLLLVIYFYFIISLYDQEEPYDKVFNAGFLVGWASLLYFPSTIFFLLLPLSLFVYRVSGWREWIISFLAFITPFLFLGTWFFWQNDLTGKGEAFIKPFTHISLPHLHPDTLAYVYLSLLGIIVMIALLNIRRKLNTITISNRKRFNITLWWLFFLLISFGFSQGDQILHAGLMGIPMAGILGFYYAGLRKPFWHEWILFILLVLIVLTRILS